TYSMRSKEDAQDYRYFPDPDLVPIRVLPSRLQAIQASIPILPDQRKKEYVQRYAISAHDAELLAADRATADYFEMAVGKTQYPKLLANLILSEIARHTDKEAIRIPINPGHMAMAAQLFGSGRINSGTAKRLVQMMWEDDRDPETLVVEEGLEQIQDPAILSAAAQEVIAENEKIVRDYVGGKKAAFQALVGQTMKKTKGKGDPAQIQEILRGLLDTK
ncbi:MAG: Asp-tRNA(Asn)/Glu-tRNA(Gln) amidotransferase GatCAB subunit B, partial [Bianqueaceae bacterium]